MQFNLLTQPSLRADAVTIADDQHLDHKLRINRGSTNVAVKGRQLVAKLKQDLGHQRVDPSQQVASRNAPFKVEQVKQLALIAGLSTHHSKPPRRIPRQTESLFAENHEPFFNSIGHQRSSSDVRLMSVRHRTTDQWRTFHHFSEVPEGDIEA